MAQQDAINLCIDQGAATLRAANELFEGFVRELGGARALPKKFTLDVPAMTELERRIEQAIVEGDLQQTEDLCDEYSRRFTAYLEGWRKQIGLAAPANS